MGSRTIGLSLTKRPVYAATIAAWALTTVVMATAIVVWGNSVEWRLGQITVYELFPVFGLVAFSTMWSQYIVGAMATFLKLPRERLAVYYRYTGYGVLGAILLHPGLLIWQLWHDGFGLPPDSYLQHYVAPSLRVAAVVGSTCLLIFLTYESHRWFSHRAWWRIVPYAVDLAMLGIFYHSLRLGSQTQSGWFRVVWLFYGASLVIVLAYKYAVRYHLLDTEVRKE